MCDQNITEYTNNDFKIIIIIKLNVYLICIVIETLLKLLNDSSEVKTFKRMFPVPNLQDGEDEIVTRKNSTYFLQDTFLIYSC